MTSARNKRLEALEAIQDAVKERRPYVWVRPGQSFEEALAESGLPDDGRNEFFMWRAAQ